jgi:hypothetical protein
MQAAGSRSPQKHDAIEGRPTTRSRTVTSMSKRTLAPPLDHGLVAFVREPPAYALCMSSSTLLRLAQLAAASAMSVACGENPVVTPNPQPAYCDAGAPHFEATSMWVEPGDSGADLVLKVIVRQLNPATTVTMFVTTAPELVDQRPDPNGGIAITLRPKVGAKSMVIPFEISCSLAQGSFTVSWTIDPVVGRAETVVMSP